LRISYNTSLLSKSVKVKGKGKVVPVLFLVEYHAVKAYWGNQVYLHAFLASALDGGEWSASRLCRFTLRERAPVTMI